MCVGGVGVVHVYAVVHPSNGRKDMGEKLCEKEGQMGSDPEGYLRL